jgi:hypothetical protein
MITSCAMAAVIPLASATSPNTAFLNSPQQVPWNVWFPTEFPLKSPMEVFMGLFSWLIGTQDTGKINNPAARFAQPSDVVRDSELSRDEKKKALDCWEQDARQLMTASNEGMPGRDEGVDPDDHHQMGQVVRAKDEMGEKPTHKPAH